MSVFIDIEGIDASGKTVIANRVKESLERRGHSVELLSKKKPHADTPEIREYLHNVSGIVWNKNPGVFPKNFLSGDAWALQLALWFKVLHEICVQSSKNEIVLVDGWFYKYYARLNQSARNDKHLVNTLLETLNACTYVFCLDTRPEICWTRRKNFKLTEIAPFGEYPRNPRRSFIEFQGAILDTLKDLGGRYNNWIMVECDSRNIDEIVLEIVTKIEVLIDEKK